MGSLIGSSSSPTDNNEDMMETLTKESNDSLKEKDSTESSKEKDSTESSIVITVTAEDNFGLFPSSLLDDSNLEDEDEEKRKKGEGDDNEGMDHSAPSSSNPNGDSTKSVEQDPLMRDSKIYIDSLKACPLKKTKHGQPLKYSDRILDELFGPPDHDFVEKLRDLGLYSSVDTVSHHDIFKQCIHILSQNPDHVLNSYISENENILALFKASDNIKIIHSPPIVGLLMKKLLSNPLIRRVRMEWTASIVRLIQLLREVFTKDAHKLRQLQKCLGQPQHILTTLSEQTEEIQAYRDSTIENILDGCIAHFDVLVYELLVIIAWDSMRFTQRLQYINNILDAEYFLIRCALDACSTTTLRICMLSMDYLVKLWIPYMQLNFPEIFSENEECGDDKGKGKRSVYNWSAVEIYEPSPFSMIPSLREDVTEVEKLLVVNLSTAFRQSINKCIIVNEDYESLKALFGKRAKITQPTRSSSRTKRSRAK